jgi:serine/threonine protein kinase
MNTHQPCNTDLIEQFLNDRLSDEQVAAFESHLESCPTCRHELDARAADESWWSQARRCLEDSGLQSSADVAAELAASVAEGTQSWEGRSAEATGEVQSSLAAIKPYLAPTDDPRMMGRVGPYEIVGFVGSGGNGVVLKGFDSALNRYVAIKLLAPRLADSGAARRRFSREAQAAAAVVHDNVMAIHAVAETQGLPYLVMPYVRGPSLEKRLRNAGPLALEEILRVGMQVATGLAAAHAQGLVHRDIKPANILLEEGVERVKITDFGWARAADDASLTRSGVIAGTPQYMSPEQARGEPVDHRTDLFSLGCLLYAACTGRSPFRAETAYGVLRKICESEPRAVREINSTVPVWFEKLLCRLLAKDPAERYSSAAEAAALFESCLAHVQQPATVRLPDELMDTAPRRSLRGWFSRIGRKRFAAITAAVVLLVIGITVVAQRGSVRIRSGSYDSRQALTEGTASRTEGSPVGGAGTVRDRRAHDGSGQEESIDEMIESLTTDVDRLQSEAFGGFSSDPIDASLEQFQSDVQRLEIEVIDQGTTSAVGP